MTKKMLKLSLAIFSFATIIVVKPMNVKAEISDDYKIQAKETVTETTYNVKIQKSGVVARKHKSNSSDIVKTIDKDSVLTVKENSDGDWVKVEVNGSEAYISLEDGQGVVYETTRELVDDETGLRQNIVDFALSFEGKPYAWGGVNPYVGVDCSGFTRYVMSNVLGKDLPHSSRAQANAGKEVPIGSVKPGDLVFYSGRSINHVGIYLGNGKVISASTEKSGIKITAYNYRTPVKAVSMF